MTLRPHRHLRGFTLLETIIVIVFSVSMFITVGLFIYNFSRISLYQKTAAQSSGSASAVMRETESLVLPANAVLQTHSFASGTYTSSSTVLVLEIPSVDSSGNTIASTHDYAVFYSVGTSAYRLLETHVSSARVSGTALLSSTMKALTFSFNDADFTKVNVVTVDVQTQAQVKQDTVFDHRNEQMRLRNK